MFGGVENPLQRSKVSDQLKHTSVERLKCKVSHSVVSVDIRSDFQMDVHVKADNLLLQSLRLFILSVYPQCYGATVALNLKMERLSRFNLK